VLGGRPLEAVAHVALVERVLAQLRPDEEEGDDENEPDGAGHGELVMAKSLPREPAERLRVLGEPLDLLGGHRGLGGEGRLRGLGGAERGHRLRVGHLGSVDVGFGHGFLTSI